MSIFNLSLVKNAQSASTELPPETPETTSATVGTQPATDSEAQKTPQESVVVLDGPLSHVYTKALNLVYAKEGMMTMLNIDSEENVNKPQKGTYVYCHPNTLTSSNQAASLSNKLNLVIAGKKYSNVVLVLESDNSANKYAQLVDEYARSIGVEVYYHRDVGLKHIRMALESGV